MKAHTAALRIAVSIACATAASFRGPVGGGNPGPAPANATAPATAGAAPAAARARLDVGFGSFEQNVTDQVALCIQGSPEVQAWSPELRRRLADNVTTQLHAKLEDAFHPLKVSIGKTWVALGGGDAQAQAVYVEKLRSEFATMFARASGSFENHTRASMRWAKPPQTSSSARRPGATDADSQLLLHRAEKALADGLLTNHCYEESLGRKAAAPAKSPAPSRFCIPSLVDGLARRLNDTLSLVSMTMRFEARALDLAQKAARGRKSTHRH